MKLRINAKLRAALIAAISTVGFTLPLAQAATQYSTPTYGGAEYVWHGDHWEYPQGTTVNNIARVDNKGGVMVINDAGTVSNPVGVADTSDYGGVKVTGATDFTTNLGSWAGSIFVGADAVLNASYGVSLKNTEAETAANVYVEGTLKITGRNNLNLNDGNSYQNWYIGQDGFIDLSGINGVTKGSRSWNIQVSVDPGEQFDLTGYTNRSLGGQLTKKFMSTGADLYTQVASFAVFSDEVEMDSSKYTINHDASGMSVTYDVETAIKNLSLTWAGGEDTWEVKGTHWRSADVETSFANGDDVTFTGSGNKANVSGAVVANAITVNGGTTIDTTASGASLTADSLTIGAGASLTLAGTAEVTGAVSVAGENALVIGAGSTLKVGGAAAKSMLLGTQVANSGTVEVTSGMSFNSSATSKMGGTLAVAAGQTLSLGTSKDNQVIDLTSLDALVLGKEANIDTKAKLATIKNLTANGTTINQQDTLDKNTVGLDLKGVTTLEGDLTITSGWKYKMNIDELSGIGGLTLTGGNEEHRAVIGNADIRSIDVTNKMTETWLNGTIKLSGTLALNGGATYAGENGSVTVAGLTGSAALTLANGITFTGSDNYTYSGALTSTGGQIVKQGTGSQTITGTALYRTIDVQAGTLVLNGSYAIDNITDGNVQENYIGVDGQAHEEGGFYLQSGTKTVYAVAATGANLDRTHAVFTYGGNDVTSQVVDGSFTIPGGDPNYSVLYVNQNTVDYAAHAAYAQGKGASITSVVVKDGATVDLGENSTVANLQFATTGAKAGVAGTGSISAFTGNGTFDLQTGAVLTLADMTLGSNQTLVTSGEGTLSMQNLKVNGGGAVATIGSNATLHQITMGSGTVNLNGDITMDRFVLSLENSASTMNIGKDANVHVTGTTLSVTNNDASFMVSNWNQVNTLNIEGRLIAEAGISSRDGKANLNVKDGGILELHQGLLYKKNTGAYTNINVEKGGTLLTAGNADDHAGAGLHVYLTDGSTLKGYYGTSDTAAIAQTLTFGAGTITLDAGAEGKTLQLNSDIDGEGVAIVKKGAGELVLNGGGNYLYNAIDVQEGTLVLNGGFELSGIEHKEGSVQYFKDAEPATVASDNGFAKYVGEVQLIKSNYGSVSVGTDAVLLLDGYSVTYDKATGKAVSSEINLDTYFINKNSETVSSIVAVAPDADVTLADGAKLVADVNYSGAISVTSGKGYVEIGKDATVQNTTAAIELSGSGTYVLATGASNLGTVTLGDSWTGAVKVTKNDLANLNLNTFGKAGSVVEIDGWSKHLNNTDAAVPYTYDPKLRLGTNGLTIADGYSGRTYIFAGGVEGTGNFMYNIGTSASNQIYAFTGDVSKWTGAYQSLKDGKTSTLKFYGSAAAMGAAIEQTQGTINIEVGNGTDVFATVFNNAVTATQLTILDKASATLKGESTIGTLAGPGALAVDAGEHTVTINGITGLSNTITLTSGTLSLNGTVNISEDMPLAEGRTYYVGGKTEGNGFYTVEGKLQVVALNGGTLQENSVSYQYGGKEIATSLTEGAITVEPTTTYDTFYVKKAGTTESLTHAMEQASGKGTISAVALSADTTLAADAEATYSLALDADASATVNVTAATTISSITGPTEGETLTISGSDVLTINGSNTGFLSDVTISGGTVKLGSQKALGEHNNGASQAKTITIAAGGTLDLNGFGDANFTYTMAGGKLTNTGDALGTNMSQTVGLTLTETSTVEALNGKEFWLRARGGNSTTLDLDGNTLVKTGDGKFGVYKSTVTAGAIEVQGGEFRFEAGGTTAANLVLNGGSVTGAMTLAQNISITAKQDYTIGDNLTWSIGDKTLTLATDEGKAITFSSKYTHGAGTLKADGTVKFTNGLTPNAGTIEVAGEVTVSGATLDLSNGGNSTGKVKVDGTGVLNVNSGMWMAKTAGIDIADGGTVNIASLQIVGTGEGGSLTTTADNVQYGTGNSAFTIANATVTATGDVTIGNTLSNVNVVTGAHTVTLNSAATGVTVSEKGTLVVNADMDLAGNLQSSGAITVNAEKTLTLGAGSSVYQTITNDGTVSLTDITLGAGFSEETEGSAYYDIDGNVTTEDQNHYAGSATTYVQVVNGGTSTGTGIKWNENSYDLNAAGRIIVGQGGADYGTFYVVNDSVNISALHEGTTKVEVLGGTLIVDQYASAITIDVTGEGTISGDFVAPTQVGIEAGATAQFKNGIIDAANRVNFTSQETAVSVENTGSGTIHYDIAEKDAKITADTVSCGLGNVTVDSRLVVKNIENSCMYTLTLNNLDTDNALDSVVSDSFSSVVIKNVDELEVKSMTIGSSARVALYSDADAQVEGTVTITDALTAGGGTLYANLTLQGHDGDELLFWNLNGRQLTLGSTLTLDTQSGLIQLDDVTMRQIAALGDRGEFLELVLDAGTGLEYIGDGWFDGVFSRTYTNAEGEEVLLGGDYNVQLLETGNFGIVKFSNVPEPTTGTLSLLALAALAARRRRH